MSAETLLHRLAKVRQTGRASWIACCPAHEDKTPSMTIRELDDGRVLVHCFGGCSVPEVLDAVGLEFDALFPPKPIEHAPRQRRPFHAADVMAALAHESLVVELTASRLAAGEALDNAARSRLLLAVARIHEGRALANG